MVWCGPGPHGMYSVVWCGPGPHGMYSVVWCGPGPHRMNSVAWNVQCGMVLVLVPMECTVW